MLGLEDAFYATHYQIALEARRLTLRIGAPCPRALEPWLARHGGRTPAWLITACNPGAQALSAAENTSRSIALRAWATAHAAALLETVNRDPTGNWPDEPGLLIAGLEEGLARSAALRFRQLAMVAVRAGAPVELLWLSPAQPPSAQRSPSINGR